MDSDSTYCRLCAELKPKNKMTNLLLNDEKRREITEKLARVHTNMDFSDNILPRTVCFVCINTLNRAFEFVLNIELAQGVLNDLILEQQIKKEATNSDTENITYESSDVKFDVNVDLKDESDKEGTDSEPRPIKNVKIGQKNIGISRKRSVNKSLDMLPLSQLKLTWADYKWLCSYCETQFPNVDELKVHSMQYHNCCNAYRCTDCNIKKLRLDSFLIHVRRHHKYLKLSCYKCITKFQTQREARTHKSTHLNSEYICPGCNCSFTNMEELNNHSSVFYKSKRVREIPIKAQNNTLTCVICQKTFKNKGSLNTHLLTHTERKRDHICEICGKCFFHKYNLAGHMLLHDDARPHCCEICKLTFKTAYQLRNHVGVHNVVKPYACDQCGRCFRLQKQLTSHSIIHTDSLPYLCTYCNKSFRFKTILNQHIRQHTGVKPYSCEICQRDFTNWSNYNKHMKRRHSMDMAKKKHTPDGVYPIDPNTGEVIIHPETNHTLEWKKKMLRQRRPGRPKLQEDVKDTSESKISLTVEDNIN